MSKIRVAASEESGHWHVKRGTYILAVYPAHAWRDAYNEARREAIYQNLGIIGISMGG